MKQPSKNRTKGKSAAWSKNIWQEKHTQHSPFSGWPKVQGLFDMHKCMLSHFSGARLFRPNALQPTRLLCPWNSPGKNTGVGCCALLQGIFPAQGLNPHLLHLLHWQASSLTLVPPGKHPALTWGRKKSGSGICFGDKGHRKESLKQDGITYMRVSPPSHLRSIFHVTCLINPACVSFHGLSF